MTPGDACCSHRYIAYDGRCMTCGHRDARRVRPGAHRVRIEMDVLIHDTDDPNVKGLVFEGVEFVPASLLPPEVLEGTEPAGLNLLPPEVLEGTEPAGLNTNAHTSDPYVQAGYEDHRKDVEAWTGRGSKTAMHANARRARGRYLPNVRR